MHPITPTDVLILVGIAFVFGGLFGFGSRGTFPPSIEDRAHYYRMGREAAETRAQIDNRKLSNR